MGNKRPGDGSVDYASLVENSPHGVAVLHREGITYINSAITEMLGYTLEDLSVRELSDLMTLFHPEDGEVILRRFQARLAGKSVPERYEFRIFDTSGELHWLAVRVILLESDPQNAVQAYVIDITERKEAELAVRRSESRLKAVIENLPFDYFAIGLDGRYVLQNAVCRKHWGDVVGKKPSELDASDETKTIWESNNQRAFEGEVVAEEVSFPYQGETLHYYNIITPVRDGDELIGIQGINVDISSVRRAEAEKAEIERQLLHTQKMEAVGRLAGGVAHDFNNLLMAIGGNINFLKTLLEEGSVEWERASAVDSATSEAMKLTNRLLGFARRDRERNQPMNLRELLDDLIELLKHSFASEISIEREWLVDEPVVSGDPGQIRHLFMNLAVNATDAMPGGGELTFSLDEPDDDLVRARVTDTGSGIPEEVMARIFEPFYTTKEPGQGTGMGLAMAFGVVESHGGSIAVNSEPGRGTTFTILFPRDSNTRDRPHDND